MYLLFYDQGPRTRDPRVTLQIVGPPGPFPEAPYMFATLKPVVAPALPEADSAAAPQPLAVSFDNCGVKHCCNHLFNLQYTLL